MTKYLNFLDRNTSSSTVSNCLFNLFLKNTRLFHLSYQILVKPTSALKRATLMHWVVRSGASKQLMVLRLRMIKIFSTVIIATHWVTQLKSCYCITTPEWISMRQYTRGDIRAMTEIPSWLAILRCHRQAAMLICNSEGILRPILSIIVFS